MYILHYGVGHLHGGHSGRYPWGSGKKVFVSGGSKTEKIPRKAKKDIKQNVKAGNRILIGDAPGIDTAVQNYIKKYNNVSVYTIFDEPRYLANKNWEVKKIKPKNTEVEGGYNKGNVDKDIAMTNDSDSGIAIPIKGQSQATRNNIQRLIDQNKNVKTYEIDSGFRVIENTKKKAKYANKVWRSMSNEDKVRMMGNPGDTVDDLRLRDKVRYTTNKWYKHANAVSYVGKYKNKPVAVFDIWRHGDNGLEAAIMTNPKYRGKGYASKVVDAGKQWIYDNYPPNTIVEWNANSNNKASRSLAEKSGFKLDKIKNGTSYYKISI